ncbi:MAG TPA: hypothetical protein VJT85_10945 [Gemmatimonadaceae bacterium]|nr:hypothetical protein [Gemmatimonadaceae bacterium]
MTSQRIIELLLRAWYWLPVRGRVGVTIIAFAQLYWVWRFYLAYVRAPWVLYRENVIPPDRTRTLDPVYSEPIDQELLAYLELTERKMMALGFCLPHRTTDRTTYPLPAVGSSLEHPRFGDQATIVAMRPPEAYGSGDPLYSIAFDAEFVDGVTLLTSNVRMLRFWPDPRKLDHVRIPHVTDPAVLYRLHRLRVIARRSDVAQKKIVRGKTPEQRLVFIKRRHIDLYKHLVHSRYHRRTAGGLRLTIRGAIKTAWRQVFPWRNIDQWWLRRRARSVMRLG